MWISQHWFRSSLNSARRQAIIWNNDESVRVSDVWLVILTENSHFPNMQIILSIDRGLVDTNPIAKQNRWASEIVPQGIHFRNLLEADWIVAYVLIFTNANFKIVAVRCKIAKKLHIIFSLDITCITQELWWRHQMETFSALLAIYAGNSPVTGEFPAQRPVTRSSDVFFDLGLNKRLSKRSLGWWSETPSCSLWRRGNESMKYPYHSNSVEWIKRTYGK